jgi:hypothetical protein
MPSTYTLNNGIELIGTGEQSGTWGDTTNTNLGLLDVALDGQVTVALASAGSSGSPNSLPISDGTASNGRNRMVVFSDSGDLGATAYVQLTPNDAEKIIYIRNSLSGSRSVILFQGTYNASNDYEVPAGTTAVVYFDGAGAGAVAANVFNNAYFDGLRLGSVSVTAILDEDNMASDSATALATQQSIKAYVDAQVGTVDTLAEILAIGNTTGATDIAVDSAQKVQFRDAAIYINSSVDGQLDIVADTEIQIAATTIDVNGALDVSGTALVTGVLTTTAATVSNGGGQFNGAINVGVDDTGYDVKFFGATTGKSLLWDESADSLIVTGTTTLVGTTNLDAVDIDGATQIDATVTVGVDDTGYDVKFFGATAGAYMLWDESADDLILGGAAGLSVNSAALVTGVLTTTAATVFNGGFASPNKSSVLVPDGTGDNDWAFKVSNLEATDGRSYGLKINAGSTTDEAFLIQDHDASNLLFKVFGNGALTQNGGAVFNEVSADVDFRVESDSNTHALFVQGSDGFVGIGTSSPSAPLEVNQGATSSPLAFKIIGSSSPGMQIVEDTGVTAHFVNDSSAVYAGSTTSHPFVLRTNNTARMTLDSSGGLITTPAAGGHAVFNEDGVDADFRVESDGNANGLYLDAGGNFIAMGNNAKSLVSGYADQHGVGIDLQTGEVQISGDATPLQLGRTTTAGAEGDLLIFRTESDVRGGISNTSANDLRISSNSSKLKLGESADYVMIDTTASNARIELVDNSQANPPTIVGNGPNFIIENGGVERVVIDGSGNTVFNDTGVDADFRVESDANTHMLFLDASIDRISMGTSDSADGTLTLRSTNNNFAMVQESAAVIPSGGIRARMFEGTYAINGNSSNSVLSIPIFSQGGLWVQYQVELTVVSGEYNINNTARGGSCIFSFTSLTTLDALVEQQVTGNISSVTLDSANMEVDINFSSAYDGGQSGWEGVLVHAKVFSYGGGYFEMDNATLN